MTALVEHDIEQGAGRLHAGLTDPGLGSTVAAYFDPANGFAGMTFSTVGSNPRDEIIAADLLAVSLLSIDWQPGAVRMLLGSHAVQVSRLLTEVRDDIDLWEASDEDLAPVDELWQTLNAMPGVGAATAAKLLARKRPRLCASTDRTAVQAAGVPVHLAGQAVRTLLQDPAARADIEALRPPAAAEASLLRILDVAIWARHSPSRDARRLRAVGLSIAACA
ncbi:MAG TPA: DUF6308 family protein [Streptosporangiaceae bacterium]